jgi:hypothetical protein
MEVFRVGLGAIIIVPAVSGMFSVLEPLLEAIIARAPQLEPMLSPHIPIEMVMLFFSGLMFVLANVIFYFRCPPILKRISSEDTVGYTEPYHLQFVAHSAASFLAHYVERAYITEEWIKIFEYQRDNLDTKIPFHPGEFDNCKSMIQSGYRLVRTGFSGNGLYHVERMLTDVANINGGRLFIKDCNPASKWICLGGPREIIFPNELWLVNGIIHSPIFEKDAVEEGKDADIFLEWIWAHSDGIIPVHRGKAKYLEDVIRDFAGAFYYTNPIEAEKVVAPYTYFERPISRLAVALSFALAILFSGAFLIFQTWNVVEAAI